MRITVISLAQTLQAFTDLNILGVEGKTAKLTCTVRSRGDRFVSWIRRGIHPVVLSSGDITFTSDTRFSVVNPPGTDDWVLSIDLARMSDRGHYECQVNTEPKINLGFWLNVLREYLLSEKLI